MCRPPRVVMIEPGICTGLDGDETVHAMFIGQGSTRTTKVRIERGGMLVLNMPIPSGGVRLPNLDECIRNGPPVAVENAPAYDDAFTDWLTWVLAGQIVIVFPNLLMPKNWSGNFRKRMWQHNKGLQRCPFDGCPIRLVPGRRLTALLWPHVGSDGSPCGHRIHRSPVLEARTVRNGVIACSAHG